LAAECGPAANCIRHSARELVGGLAADRDVYYARADFRAVE
jgi:hypothetical protein